MILLSLIYFCIVCAFVIGILKKKQEIDPTHKNISVIIAARNEEKHLPRLLENLCSQNYPKHRHEIIIADDRSTDNTAQIIKKFQKEHENIRYVQITSEQEDLVGKKGALQKAIDAASYEILAFTDADCLPPDRWLQKISENFTSDVDYLAGYSPLIIKNKLLAYLKNLERASHFAVTAGSIGLNWLITSSARNIAYRKSVFFAAQGFEGIGHIRSGDDDLLLQKMAHKIRKARFLFDRETQIPSHDKDNMQQMIELESRRASKWKYYPLSVKAMTLFIFSYYLIFTVYFIYNIVNLNFDSLFFLNLIIKILPEFLLLLIYLIKVRNLKLLLVFPIAELIYIPYYIFFGLKGTLGKYRWKN